MGQTGDKGIGKTTLIYSLLHLPLDECQSHSGETSPVHIYSSSLGDGDRKMRISVADTPGLDTMTNGQTTCVDNFGLSNIYCQPFQFPVH